MLFRIVVQSIRSRLDLYTPMILAVVITLSLIGAAKIVDNGFRDIVNREMDKYGANVILRPESGDQTTAGVPVEVNEAAVNGQKLKVAVTPLQSLLDINPSWIVRGEGKVVVGQQAAAGLKITPGDQVTLDETVVRAAVLKTGTEFDSYVFRDGTSRNISLRFIKSDQPEKYKGRNAVILQEMVKSKYKVLGSIENLMLIIALVSAFASFATVVNLARIDAGERKKEFGIFKSLGGSGRRIAVLITTEYLFLAILSIAASTAGAFVLSWGILQYVGDYTPVLSLPGLLYILIVTVLAYGFAGMIYIIESKRHRAAEELRAV